MAARKEIFGDGLPSVVKDPFRGGCINKIHMHAIKSLFHDRFIFSGSVDFKNGSTEGTQNFEADSLGELYTQIQNFCLTLEE